MLPPKIGDGVAGSRVGGDHGFFSSFFLSSFFSFVPDSAAVVTLQKLAQVR